MRGRKKKKEGEEAAEQLLLLCFSLLFSKETEISKEKIPENAFVSWRDRSLGWGARRVEGRGKKKEQQGRTRKAPRPAKRAKKKKMPCVPLLLLLLAVGRRRQFFLSFPSASSLSFPAKNPPLRCNLLELLYASEMIDKQKTPNNSPCRRGGRPSWSMRRPTASCAGPRCSG